MIITWSSLRSGANDVTPKVMWLSYSRNQCLRFWLRAYSWPSRAGELWGRDWLTIKLNNARILKQWGNLRITRHADRHETKDGADVPVSRFSDVASEVDCGRFASLPLSLSFFCKHIASPRSKTVIHCLKSCKEFLANPSASAQKPLFYCLLREIQRTSSTESSSSRIRRHFDSTTQQQQTKCKGK